MEGHEPDLFVPDDGMSFGVIRSLLVTSRREKSCPTGPLISYGERMSQSPHEFLRSVPVGLRAKPRVRARRLVNFVNFRGLRAC